MTCGIYRLVFTGTDKCYIGQSVNIENRYYTHISSFENSRANEKLMEAVKHYGNPKLEILCECYPSELNSLELEAMEIFDSVNNGFNVLSSPYHTPTLHGQDHPKSKYTNNQILEAAELLIDRYNTKKYIQEKTGVSLDTLKKISELKQHGWIKEVRPDIYNKLVSLLGKRNNPNPNTAEKQGIKYPSVISPDGNLVENINNLSEFCRTNNLITTNFSKLLKGKRKSCQGWRLASG